MKNLLFYMGEYKARALLEEVCRPTTTGMERTAENVKCELMSNNKEEKDVYIAYFNKTKPADLLIPINWKFLFLREWLLFDVMSEEDSENARQPMA
jgi:hypothetical protein